MSDYVPEDVMIKILELLPAESLFRFRRVCKWMNDFIDSPSFIQRHMALQKPRFISIYRGQEFLVINPHTPFIVSAPLARHSESERVSLVGTLHGVVCFYYSKSHFLLCNLSIRKSLILRMPDLNKPAFTQYHNHDEPHGNRVQEYDRSNVASGFWIDPETTEFKIVIFNLIVADLDAIRDAILYSSIMQDWEPLFPRKVRMHQSLSHRPAVVIGKVGYWRVFKGSEVVEIGDEEPWLATEYSIVSFDFEKKVFGMIKTPRVDYMQLDAPELSRWRDTLSLLCVDMNYGCEVYIWETEDSWVKVLSFDLVSVTYISRVLAMVESEGMEADSEEELLENRRILAATSTSLVLCDKGAACVALKSGLADCDTLSVAYDYVGSLLFPDYSRVDLTAMLFIS